MTATQLSEDVQQKFIAIVGSGNAVTQVADIEPYVREMRGRYVAAAALVLRPNSTEQVAKILSLATETRTPIVPQGGNTGLVGAGVPLRGSEGAVVVSLSRMNRILDVDPDTNTMTVEAGVVLQSIQEAADEADRLFPLSLGSQGSCQIGGNLSSNAGGTGVLAYGNTRDLVMGIEAVLPTGEVMNALTRLRKDNTGYDLKHLFIGGEGTLGIVTKIVLKLFARPKGRELAYVGLASPQDALKLFRFAQDQAIVRTPLFRLWEV